MDIGFLNIILAAFDLLTLFLCIGALACHLYVLPPVGGVSDCSLPKVLCVRLWRLLGVGIATLTISSIAVLFVHAMEMSDSSFPAVFSVLHTVILQTRYGHLWLVRPLTLAALWIGWQSGGRRLDSRVIPVFMLIVGAIVALTRSASGHTADWGYMALPLLMDWLHLLSASVWGGGLIALSIVVLPKMIETSQPRRELITYIARRFSKLAGIALCAILVTATYNAWIQLGSFPALWHTSYGQMIIVKILLLSMLIVLGSSNRFISIPLLHNPFLHNPDSTPVIRRFIHKVRAEAILIILAIICTAFLLNWVPARHSTHIISKWEVEVKHRGPRVISDVRDKRGDVLPLEQ